MTAAQEQAIPGIKLSVRVQRGGPELVEQIAGEWRRVCDESGDEEVFYRPEWAQAYLQAFEPEADVVMISAWAGERLRGILPLVRRRTVMSGLPIVQLTLPANVHCLRASLTVCPGEEGATVLKALWEAAKNIPSWHLIDVANVVEGSAMDRLLALAQADGYRAARKRTSQTLYLPIDFSAAASTSDKSGAQPPWLAGTRPKFRSHLRRAKRQLEEQGTLELKHYSEADPEALENFYALEASGWKGAEGTAIKCDAHTRQFYDAIAQAAARDGYLSLDFLELNGKPIAGHFGFNLRGRYFLPRPVMTNLSAATVPVSCWSMKFLARRRSAGCMNLISSAPPHGTRAAGLRRGAPTIGYLSSAKICTARCCMLRALPRETRYASCWAGRKMKARRWN